MPPRKVKPDPEEESQESPDLSTIQPVPDNTIFPGTETTSGLRLPNISPTHPLPVIHETGESYFGSAFPSLPGTIQGLSPHPFPYPSISGIGSIPDASQHPFAFNPLYSTGEYNMNNMSRNIMSSSGNARNQGLGNSGTGAGVTKRQSRQAASGMSQAVTGATRGMAVNPGQIVNQHQGFDVDLTGMDYPTSSPSTMGLYGSTLNSGMDPNAFASSSYNGLPGVSGGMQQNPQHQDYRNMSPIPKFDPDLIPTSPDFITPSQYESFGEDEYETKPDPRRIRTEGTPTPAPRNRRASLAAQTDISPATANTSSPANSSFDVPPDQGSSSGGGGAGGRQAANNQPPSYQAHVPPNRIAEAGPVTHPDPEWRPYGVNHWHVFLREPTTLKYLSSTEIKDIREHCYELASQASGDANNNGDGDQQESQPRPVAEGSPYTTADAQAVWRHCDAYVRRRSQVRNNQAARRSRQRKDAETRYWKAKALEYGAPDHEFDWSMVEDSPPAAQAQSGAGSSSSSRAAAAAEGGSAVQTRARARGQARAQQLQGEGQGQVQGQAHGQGQGQAGRGGGGRQGQAAARRESAPSAAPPEFDFNQPLEYDEDDKTYGGGFDAFTGEF